MPPPKKKTFFFFFFAESRTFCLQTLTDSQPSFPLLAPPLLSYSLLSMMCANAQAYLCFETAITGIHETSGGIRKPSWNIDCTVLARQRLWISPSDIIGWNQAKKFLSVTKRWKQRRTLGARAFKFKLQEFLSACCMYSSAVRIPCYTKDTMLNQNSNVLLFIRSQMNKLSR